MAKQHLTKQIAGRNPCKVDMRILQRNKRQPEAIVLQQEHLLVKLSAIQTIPQQLSISTNF